MLQIVFIALAESNYLVSCFTFVFLFLRFYIKHCKSPVLKYTLTTLECIAILHNLLGSVTMYNSSFFANVFVWVSVVYWLKRATVYSKTLKNVIYTSAQFFLKKKKISETALACTKFPEVSRPWNKHVLLLGCSIIQNIWRAVSKSFFQLIDLSGIAYWRMNFVLWFLALPLWVIRKMMETVYN